MNLELKAFKTILSKSKCAEDLFGALKSKDPLAEAKKLYHSFVKVCHQDRYTDPKDKKAADEAFKMLTDFWQITQAKISDGSYGDKKAKPTKLKIPVAITVHSKKHIYVVNDTFASGDIAELLNVEYSDGKTTKKALMKVARHPKDQDMMAAEASALAKLAKIAEAEHRVPTVLESISVSDVDGKKRSANVFSADTFNGLESMDDILTAYKMQPLDPRDVAWMGSRMWTTLGIIHNAELIHGAVVPSHCLICAENHGMVLVDWCYSVKVGESIKAIAPKWKALYPPEVFKKLGATPALDIYMAAFTLTIMLGAETNITHNPKFPSGVPREMQRFLQACLIPSPHRRPQDAWQLAADWKTLLEKLFGKPKFRVFNVPAGT
jgi:curved DNA-binding protein CbpA